MAKKKRAVIDLSDRALSFELDGATARLISFNPNTMTLQVNFYAQGGQVRSESSFPFAHLPKSLKKSIKPN